MKHFLDDENDEKKYIGKYLSAIFRHMKLSLSRKLDIKHFGGGKFPFLLIVSKNPGVTQEEISKEILIDKAVTAKAIKQLENLDYIKRVRNSDDKRCFNLYLTEKGEKLVPTIWDAIEESHKVLLENFTQAEEDQLRYYLKKIFINIKNHNQINENFDE